MDIGSATQWHDLAQYLAKLKPLLALWAAALASPTTYRSARFVRLEAVQRHAQQIEVPVTLAGAHHALIAAMDATISAYLKLAAGQPGVRSDDVMAAATSGMEVFSLELARVVVETLQAPALQNATRSVRSVQLFVASQHLWTNSREKWVTSQEKWATSCDLQARSHALCRQSQDFRQQSRAVADYAASLLGTTGGE